MDFLSYIQGKRYGEEARWIEKEALSDPFLQDAIDGYDKVNDRPSYHLKRLEERLAKRTKRKFNFLRFWGIVAAILIIICLSMLFFLNSRVNVLRDTAFLENHKDDVISNYKIDSVQYAEDSVLYTKKDSVQYTKDSIITTNQIANNSIVRPEETEKLKTNRAVAQEAQNNMSEEPEQYTLSNEETQALFLSDKKSGKIYKSADNPAQTQTQTPKPEKGNKAYSEYIERNRRQLPDANCDNQHGKVILIFHVNNQGRPVDVAILRSLCPEADKEAVRLLQNGPNWTVSDLSARLEVAF